MARYVANGKKQTAGELPDNAYDSIREKLGLNTENVVAGVTMAGLSIFTVIYLIGAARRGTMALE